jgi:Protein of unknown function (DUF4031)
MSIFVDQCRWSHKDHHWCHMVSDVSIEDLHRFAAHLGVPRRAFHGDHYDLPQHVRDLALVHGAIEVSSREVVAILTRTGLRMSPAQRRAYVHDDVVLHAPGQ